MLQSKLPNGFLCYVFYANTGQAAKEKRKEIVHKWTDDKQKRTITL